MRLMPIPPSLLPPHLRALHEAIDKRMNQSLSAFLSKDGKGALIGPFPPLLHFPQFGEPAFNFLDALVGEATLPKSVRETTILVVGARFKARYELYSHEKMAAGADLTEAQIATIVAGQRPPDLDEASATAFDYAAAALEGPVASATYNRAFRLFGREGVGELTFLIGGYAVICTLLNAFDVPIPTERNIPENTDGGKMMPKSEDGCR